MADLEKLGYKFMLSFYKDEIIQYEKMVNTLQSAFYQEQCQNKETILKPNL